MKRETLAQKRRKAQASKKALYASQRGRTRGEQRAYWKRRRATRAAGVPRVHQRPCGNPGCRDCYARAEPR